MRPLALTAAFSGDFATTGVAAGTAQRHVRGGMMRILASWGKRRIFALPAMPTFRDAGLPDGPDLVRFLAQDAARLTAARRRIGRVEQARDAAASLPPCRCDAAERFPRLP